MTLGDKCSRPWETASGFLLQTEEPRGLILRPAAHSFRRAGLFADAHVTINAEKAAVRLESRRPAKCQNSVQRYDFPYIRFDTLTPGPNSMIAVVIDSYIAKNLIPS